MTIVELLIVIVVIGILVSSVLVASSTLRTKARTNSTQALLQVVADAVEQFKREQSEKPTVTRNAVYKNRYGLYPPDELEAFHLDSGVGGIPGPDGSPKIGIAPGGARVVPKPPYEAMRFYTDSTDADAKEHRDLAAMILAIETLSDSAAAILDRVPERNRTAGPLKEGNPSQFLDRPNPTSGKPNDLWDAEDTQIRYIVDDWGNPISYFAQRDYPVEPSVAPVPSSNHADWNEASTEFIRLNGAQPVIMSYGPNGKDQLTRAAMEPGGTDKEAKVSLVGDFESEQPTHHVVDDPFNDDNVYSNAGLREKLAKGIP